MIRNTTAGVGLLLAAALIGCGRDDRGPAERGDEGSSTLPAPPRRRQGAGAENVSTPAPAEIEALLAAWRAAPRGDERSRLEDRLVEAGAPALERLLDLVVRGDEPFVDYELIARFGPSAVPRLLALLDLAEARPHRRALVGILEFMAPQWRDAPEGPSVCRALFALLGDDDAAPDAVLALEQSRPAGRVVARDLADLWLRGEFAVASRAHRVLVALGPDAAPAAPQVVEAFVAAVSHVASTDEEEDPAELSEDVASRLWQAAEILERIGSSDPSILVALRHLLGRSAPADQRAIVAEILVSWGDAAATAAPELISMLGAPSAFGQAAAGRALLAMPSRADAVWQAISDAFARGDEWTHAPEDALSDLARHPFFRSRLAALLPTLPPGDLAALQRVLAARGAADLVALAPALSRSDSAEVRRLALDPWLDDDERAPLPAEAILLLDDPDMSVRSRAAAILAARGGAPPARIRDAVLPLVGAAEPDVRADAIRALGPIATTDRVALDAVLAAFDADPADDVRLAAAYALALGDGVIAGEHPGLGWLQSELTAALADVFAAHRDVRRLTHALLRFPQGAAALSAAVTKAAQQSWHANWAGVADAVVEAGPRVAALRPLLVRLRESDADQIDRALAAIDDDPVAIASSEWRTDQATVTRLLAMGETGERAVVLLFGRINAAGDPPCEWFEGVPIRDHIAAAARADSSDPLAPTLRRGAARLACVLAPEEALEVLVSLVDRMDAVLRWVVPDALAQLDGRSPGRVPVPLVRRLVEEAQQRDESGAIEEAVLLAGAIGPRAADLVPALQHVRDTARAEVASCAAVSLWRIMRRADEALPVLRRILATAGRDELMSMRWDEIAGALAEMPLEGPDLDVVVGVLRRDPASCAESRLVPLLGRFGDAAASAVPILRRILGRRDDGLGPVEPGPGEDAARVLAAIGPAARDALPDLRAWIADVGDPRGVAREAIRSIETGAR